MSSSVRIRECGVSRTSKTLLPAAAKEVYYRADIGNISTSWKTNYVTGYNVPSYEALLDNNFNDMLVEVRSELSSQKVWPMLSCQPLTP